MGLPLQPKEGMAPWEGWKQFQLQEGDVIPQGPGPPSFPFRSHSLTQLPVAIYHLPDIRNDIFDFLSFSPFVLPSAYSCPSKLFHAIFLNDIPQLTPNNLIAASLVPSDLLADRRPQTIRHKSQVTCPGDKCNHGSVPAPRQ